MLFQIKSILNFEYKRLKALGLIFFASTSIASSQTTPINDFDLKIFEYLIANNIINDNNEISVLKTKAYTQLLKCNRISYKLISKKKIANNLKILAICEKSKSVRSILNVKTFIKSDDPITTSSDKKGDHIEIGMLEKNTFNNKLHKRITSNPDDFIDNVSARNVSIHTTLQKNSNLRQKLLRRNDKIDVLLVKEGFYVKVKAKALNDAAKGDIVRVQLGAQKIVLGIAIDKSTVELKID